MATLCNNCGRAIGDSNKEGLSFHLENNPPKQSCFSTETCYMNFDLCIPCIKSFTTSFKIPPTLVKTTFDV